MVNEHSLNGNGGTKSPMEVTHPFYQIIKDATFNFYLWGLSADDANDEIFAFYKDMLDVFRRYDDKFVITEKGME